MRRLSFAVVLAAWLCGAVFAAQGEFAVFKPEDIQWKDYPGVPGLSIALLQGNPRERGLYVLRVKFAPGTMTRPHFHPDDRYVTVIQGTWYAGVGEVFDPNRTQALPAGSMMKHPAGAPHYDGAKDEEVIVQIIGLGPSNTVFLNPADDPGRR